LNEIAEVKRTDWLGYDKDLYDKRSIGEDVQAYSPNRLEVLHFHGVVLSVKVKARSVSCMARLCMVGTEELSESEPLLRCRK